MDKNSINIIKNSLNCSTLFSSLSGNLIQELASKHCSIKHFNKGKKIFPLSNGENRIGIIISGEALVTKNELVINKLHCNDIFGAVTLYRKKHNFANTISAYTDCDVVFVSSDGVDYLINNSPAFSKKYIEYLSDRIYFLNTKIKAYTTSRAEDKLYNFLLSASEENSIVLDIKMTELARAINLSRASLYRCLEKLINDGKIKKEGNKIFILNQ